MEYLSQCVCVCVYVCESWVAEWLEHELDVREVSGSIPGQGEQTNLCSISGSDYVCFRMDVKRERFHTLQHTIQSQEQH